MFLEKCKEIMEYINTGLRFVFLGLRMILAIIIGSFSAIAVISMIIVQCVILWDFKDMGKRIVKCIIVIAGIDEETMDYCKKML